jgi:hypothetical protein
VAGYSPGYVDVPDYIPYSIASSMFLLFEYEYEFAHLFLGHTGDRSLHGEYQANELACK